MAEVGDLVKQAMLNPDLARQLLAKVPAKAGTRQAITLAQLLRRFSMFAPITASSTDRRQ